LNRVVRVAIVQFNDVFAVVVCAVNIVTFNHAVSYGGVVEISFELVPFRFSGFAVRAPINKEEENVDRAFAVVCVSHILEFDILLLFQINGLENIICDNREDDECDGSYNIILIWSDNISYNFG